MTDCSQAFYFLATIPPPTQSRQKVASPTTPVQDLFPVGKRTWRSVYSLHVLQVHRQDFAKIGVADDDYIQQGVRLLVATLTDSDRPLDGALFAVILSALTNFLQGMLL